ncbi:MAG: hypothetical protein ACKVS8_00530 [Phycisphaerales bacterium]
MHRYHSPAQRLVRSSLPAARRLALAMLAGGALGVGALGGLGGCAADTSAPTTGQITGRYIAVLCDGDMTATAFADEMLAPRPGAKDVLTVVPLPIADPDGVDAIKWQTSVTQIPVSNSVGGPPVSVAASPDGTRVYAVESKGPAGPGATRMSDLPVGRLLTSVCMDDPAAPHLIQSIEVGDEPMSVDVHPDGDLVAVATRSVGGQIVIVPTDNEDGFGEPMRFPLVGLDRSNARPSCIAWHPDGNHFAVTLPETNEVAFFEFRRTAVDGGPGIAPWGEPVQVGKFPFSGRFSPDGRFFITSDLHWGPDVEGFLAGAPEGTLSAIRVSRVPTCVVPAVNEYTASGSLIRSEDGRVDLGLAVHEVVSTAVVGISPESMAISPDGKFIATANIRRAFLKDGDTRQTRGGSLSLVGFNTSTGELTNHGELDIPAMPEGLAFDASGKHLVVSQFMSFEPGAVDGELSFYKLIRTNPPTLLPADFYVGVGIGPHGVVIVR